MKKAIASQDIKALQKDGVLVVTRDMVLTPEAREFASKAGIALKYSQDVPPPAKPIEKADLARLIEQIVVEEVTKATSRTEQGPQSPRGEVPPLGGRGEPGSPQGGIALPTLLPESAARDPGVRRGVDADCLRQVLNVSTDEDTSGRAIVTVVGHNRPGVVARISSAVAECGGDLADVSQVIIGDYFSMIFIVNLAGLQEKNLSFRVFKERLQDEAARLGRVQILVMHEAIFQAMHKV